MSTTVLIAKSFARTIILLGIGCAVLLHACAIKQNPGNVKWIWDSLSLWLAHRFRQEHGEKEIEKRSKNPERIQKIAREGIVAGRLLIALGVVQALLFIAQTLPAKE